MFLLSKTFAFAQKIPEDFGYRHIKMKYLDDPVDIIVISKPDKEKIAKPLFLFCQSRKFAATRRKIRRNGFVRNFAFRRNSFFG
jgi:hypothetical protein